MVATKNLFVNILEYYLGGISMSNEMLSKKELEEKVREDFDKAEEKRNKYIIAFKDDSGAVIASPGSKFEKITNCIIYAGKNFAEIKNGTLVSGSNFTIIIKPSKLISGAFYDGENQISFRMKTGKDKTETFDTPFLALFETETKIFVISFDVKTQIVCSVYISPDLTEIESHKAIYNSLYTQLRGKDVIADEAENI